MPPPVIAIPTHSERVRYGAWEDAADVVGSTLVRAAQAAGARVLLIPLDEALLEDPRQVLERVHGVVAEAVEGHDDGRWSFPVSFADRAEAAGVPVLRIAHDPSAGDGAGRAEAIGRFVESLGR